MNQAKLLLRQALEEKIPPLAELVAETDATLDRLIFQAGEMEKFPSSLLPILERLEVMAKGGVLDKALDTLVLLDAFLGALTPFMVEKLATLGSEGIAIMERVVEYRTGEVLEGVHYSLRAGAAKSKEKKPPGLLGLVREMGNPKVRTGLSILLALLKDLPGIVEEMH